MAHNITIINGQASMAYVGATPWHGLGKSKKPGDSFDSWRKDAGFDWEVNRAPVRFTDSDGNLCEFDGQEVLYRSDNGLQLAIVSNRYQIVQPGEVLEFYRDLCNQYGFELETAGTLLGGKKLWALAKTGMTTRVKGADVVNGYLLLATSNDGTMATIAKFTSVRVVCNNTLNLSLTETAFPQVKVSHRTVFNPDTVKAQLGIIRSAWDEFDDVLGLMADVKVSKKQIEGYIFDLFAKTDKPENESTRNKNIMQNVWLSIANSPGANLPSAAGTTWGLVNGVTHFVDHVAGARTQDNRLQSAWFGKGEELKDKAFKLAYDMAKAA